jgi:hypothetical protein
MKIITAQLLDDNENVSFSVDMPCFVEGYDGSFDNKLKSDDKLSTFVKDNLFAAVKQDKLVELLKNTVADRPFGQLYIYTAIANDGMEYCLNNKETKEEFVSQLEKAIREVSEINDDYEYLMYVFEEVIYRINKQKNPYRLRFQVQVFTREERAKISNKAFMTCIDASLKKVSGGNH